jgi:hypothetical protein
MNKDFTSKLTEEQAQFALEIADKAIKMGIDPRLAVALAFAESGLNPNATGTKGEIGLMQVRPVTAEGMGYTLKDLAIPSKNIEIGLTYLKSNLDKFGSPTLAVAGYNAGPNHPYFDDPENRSLPASTEDYLKKIRDLGGFTPTPVAQDEATDSAPPPPPAPASEDDFNKNKMRMLMDTGGMLAGAAAAKAADVGTGVVGGVRDIVRASRSLPGALSVLQSMQNAGSQVPPAPPAPTAPPQAPSMARPVAGGPAGPVGGPVSPLNQMGGSGTYNYGKAFGLSDIEAVRATDMTKNPGGANDLINQRTQALQKIQQMGGGYVENPNFSGIMTPEQSAGGGPRASFVQNPSAPGGMAQLPPAQPVSAAPPAPPRAPGPLSQAANVAKQGAGAVMRSPLTMGALGGLSMAEGVQDVDARLQAGDTTGAAIAGTGTVGGGMMMLPSPRLKAIGSLISAASPLTQYLRDKIRSTPEAPELSEEEIMMNSRPAFGVYPNAFRRGPMVP